MNAAEWPLNTVRTLLGRVNAAEWPLNTLRTLLGRVNSETFHERLMMGRVNTETFIMRTLWVHCLLENTSRTLSVSLAYSGRFDVETSWSQLMGRVNTETLIMHPLDDPYCVTVCQLLRAHCAYL